MKGIKNLFEKWPNLISKAREGAEFIDSIKNETIRIISHRDADGIAAAGIICSALFREKKDFRVSIIGASDEIDYGNDPMIFCDIGGGRSEEIENFGKKVIICDHHLPNGNPSNAINMNAHLFGIDGMNEACGSSIALALTLGMDERNFDLSPLAIVGMIGDQQFLNQGYNGKIFEMAMKNGIVRIERKSKLVGKVQESIESSIDPFFKDFSGKEGSSLKMLDQLGIELNLDMDEIDKGKKEELFSLLEEKLFNQGTKAKLIDNAPFNDKYGDLFDLASILDACGRMDRHGIGLAICFGDRNALKKGIGIRNEYKKKILDGLLKLEKGCEQMKNIQYFYIDGKISGIIANLGIKYILKKKPVLAISRKNGKIDISARATRELVNRGVNLAVAMREAKKFGGNGGGHPIAAGATIPIEKKEEFLKRIDDRIGGMINDKRSEMHHHHGL
jgi:single-stranded DNA-specific DHH superfamily exonuclease